MAAERLHLLTVVRGLEELDQPSRVTLYTTGRSVIHGVTFGLAQWRESDWMWERFEEMVPIADQDLWQRFDRAHRIHRIECRYSSRRLLDVARVSCEVMPTSRMAVPRRRVPGSSRSLGVRVGQAARRFARIAASIAPV
jgi:hypothetical protein